MKFVPRGGVVLDPFLGGGTAGVAAIQRGYGFIGVEIDYEAYATAADRLATAAAALEQAAA